MSIILRSVCLILSALLSCLGAGFAPSAQAAGPLPDDAYIWQRKWTPEVTEAMRASEDLVDTWHVLAAEYGKAGGGYRWARALPDWQVLAAARRPAVAVFRIDGQMPQRDEAELMAGIAATLQTWRDHGVQAAGIEIDYDCGTARLAAYARFLRALRPALDKTARLSITALPTWLGSADLDDLLASSDEAVLQLHAVMNPVEGLFDPDQAYLWMTQFAQRTHRPWRVALPSYGTRVTWNAEGRIVAIESEHSALYPGGIAHELIAAPKIIRAFVARIDREPPRGLIGITWFRLPTAADARAWSLATWRAVLSRAELSERLEVQARPAESEGLYAAGPPQGKNTPSGGSKPEGRSAGALYDVLLSSTGNADAELPGAIRISGACAAADGINGYTLAYDAQGMILRRTHRGLLRAGTRINIGWLRCDADRQNGITFHVQS